MPSTTSRARFRRCWSKAIGKIIANATKKVSNEGVITVEEALALGLRPLLSFIHRLEFLVDAQCIRLARGFMLPVALVSTLAHTVARMSKITTITLSERGLSGRECPAQLSKIHRAAEPGLEMA
jgi:hypothetical protein